MKKSKIFSRAIASVLALCCLCGAAVSCSTTEDAINRNITASSSAAEETADILQKKLPYLDRRVILGTADDGASYNIDMSDFEDDGYIIKSTDEAVLLFGKTEYGLTTAANRFVNMYKTNTIEDVAFHEGYRIEKLEIFGTDISEYVIEYPESANENMKFAASELQRLVRQATGAELPVHVGASGKDHVIEFRHSSDTSLGTEGYRYFDEDGTLVIEGAVERGCMNGVYRFLQVELGWDELMGGDSVLRESDCISIPAGIDKTETPAFDYFFIHNQIWEKFKNDRNTPTVVQNSYGTVTHACHGLLRFLDTGDGWQDQPCYTSEENYEIFIDRIFAYIEGQIAAGRTPGVDLIEIDIAQTDSSVYCTCPECMKVFTEEGNAHAGAVVRFANRISEEVNAVYPGIVFKIFGYAQSNKPPKVTVPNEYIYVTYCFDGNCSNHPLDASECNGGLTGYGRKNEDYAEWFEGWTDICDNVYVWFYSLDNDFKGYTVIDTIYKDFTYLARHGVKGIMWQSTDHGLGMKRIDHQLGYNLNWDIDMTEDEYYELYYRLLEKEYGAGWEYVREFIDIMDEAQNLMGCWHCWNWGSPRFGITGYSNSTYDTRFYSKQYDYVVEIMDRALEMAESPENIMRCERLMINALYMGCYSEYFIAYEKGDDARIAVLSERFDRAMGYMKKHGFNLNKEVGEYTSVDGSITYFHYSSLEDAAWIDWYLSWDGLYPNHTRPEPEKYVGMERK